MKKKILIFTAVLIFVLAFSVLTVNADTVASGSCGTNLTWNLDDSGTLIISGTGTMKSYSSISTPWYSKRLSIKKIIVEDEVEGLDDSAFYNCDNLEEITLPFVGLSETSTGRESVFGAIFGDDGGLWDAYCSYCDSGNCVIQNLPNNYSEHYNIPRSLKKVTITRAKTIPDYAFNNCKNLTEINLSDNVTTMGSYAFYNCTCLTSVIISDSVTTIGSYAFENCTGLTNVTIGNRVTGIGRSVFYNCTSLTSITIPDSVTDIDVSAFRGCTNLTSVTIPDSVTVIENYAFYCKNLTDVYYTGTLKSWKSITIREYNDKLNSATIHFMKSDIVTKDTDGKIRYYVDGVPQTGWVETSDGFKYYFFKKDGSAAVGKNVKIGSTYYDFTDGGALIKEYTENGSPIMYRNGFCDFGNFKKYFVNGEDWHGWQVIDGYKYYFSLSNGRMLTGSQQIGILIYNFDENGRWTGYYYNFEEESSPKSDLTVKDDDGKYRYYENGEAFKGWKVLKGDDGYYKYYFTKGDGSAMTGYNKQIGSQYYDFYPTGTYIKVERADNGNAIMTDYILSFEQGAKNGLLLEEDGEWRYFVDGEFQSGWIETETGKYLFRKADGSAITSADHQTEAGYRYGSFNYIFDENGKLLSRTLK